MIVQKFPRGYPHLAAFADSDESYMLYRRFGYLQSRILLDKQDELRCLEEQLDELDASEMYLQADKLFRRGSLGEQRKALLDDIERKFCEYGKCLSKHQIPAPTKLTRSHSPGDGSCPKADVR